MYIQWITRCNQNCNYSNESHSCIALILSM